MSLRWDLSEAERAEHALEAIISNARNGFIPTHTAIRQLRERGMTEPEICEMIGR